MARSELDDLLKSIEAEREKQTVLQSDNLAFQKRIRANLKVAAERRDERAGGDRSKRIIQIMKQVAEAIEDLKKEQDKYDIQALALKNRLEDKEKTLDRHRQEVAELRDEVHSPSFMY